MEKAEQEKLALALFDRIDQKREDIKRLTSEIMELENDPKNVVRIKQDVQSVLNAVASFSSDSDGLELVKSSAKLVFIAIQMETREDDHTIDASRWYGLVKELEDFCIEANSWNPIKFNFDKSSKITINFQNINFAILGNYLQFKK